VPDVLLSGHHEAIRLWRRKQALRSTYVRRPDLLKDRIFTKEDQQLLDELMSEGLLTASTSRREEG
jgi:tRNA (guanine37-N1)-methyltransferase